MALHNFASWGSCGVGCRVCGLVLLCVYRLLVFGLWGFEFQAPYVNASLDDFKPCIHNSTESQSPKH